MCLKSYFKKIVLKLATNRQSDKGFLFISTFVPKDLSAPAPGLYMYKSIKIYTRTRCQVSVYRTTGLLVFYNIHRNSIKFSFLEDIMFMSTTDDRNHIVNEWTCDKKYWKLMYGQIIDTKHIKTLISRPFGNLLDFWLVGDLYFCPWSTSR